MHARNASNVQKSVSAIHMRSAANVLKTVPTMHMRNAANVLKTAYSSGVGGGSVSVSPQTKSTTSTTSRVNASDFTATFGGSPTSITWVIANQSNCTVAILSGQGTATARIQLTVDPGQHIGHCDVICSAVIGGSPTSDSASKTHNYTGP